MPEQLFVIEKAGFYYRSNQQGYTAFKEEAARYTLEEVSEQIFQDGLEIHFWKLGEAPDYSTGCDDMTQLMHRLKKYHPIETDLPTYVGA